MHYQGFLAAMSPGCSYNRDKAIATFFAKTSTCREACEKMAVNVVGGRVEPVAVQGNCSYTIFAGRNLDFVFQYRLQSLPLNMDVLELARSIHGSVVPPVLSCGEMGGVHIYAMPRIQCLSYLDLILSGTYPRNSKESFALRKTLIEDAACFFATSWNAPQKSPQDFGFKLGQEYKRDLEILLQSFPTRFHKTIRECLNSLNAILALPVVLLHRDFSTANLLVNWATGQLEGVLDWGEAGLGPFGQNLHFLQNLMCVLDTKEGWRPLNDYKTLQETFWSRFDDGVGGISPDTIKTIKLASITGLLLYRGFTRRLPGMAHPIPISEDEEGLFSFQYLDAFLLDPETKILDLD